MSDQPGRRPYSPVLRVTVEDLESGETQTTEIPAGDYVILTTDPCHLHHINAHANGTVMLTVKGWMQR